MSLNTMYQGQINSPTTTLSVAISNTDMVITLTDVSVLPSAPNILTIGYDTDSPETCSYTLINGNNVTIQRALEGVAQSWNSGAKVARVFTAYDYNTLINNIKDLNKQSIAMSIVLG